MKRRSFLKHIGGLAGLPLLAQAACTSGRHTITGSIVGANSRAGHLLRNNNPLPPPVATIKTKILVVGGGISGLSACRWLQQKGETDVMLVELGDTGGNSAWGQNSVSAYPWGAHYLPIPDVNNREILDFLHQAGVITSYNEAALPMYNEYHLCHDPEERLFINGMWQEGLVPQFGIKAPDREQIKNFLAEVEALKVAKGNDGLDAFAIPLDRSSKDPIYRNLDQISFQQYLSSKGYNSPYLLWYLEYCCKDDFGSGLSNTSAWAGLHYFASRKGKAANTGPSAVLTWPEGNGYLVKALNKQIKIPVKKGMVARSITITDTGVEVLCTEAQTGKTIKIEAGKVLLCTPQFVNRHLLKEVRPIDKEQFVYSPWMVANITCNNLPESKGYPLCWDNVLYGQPSVGYVYANHQNLNRGTQGVLTYYLPFPEQDAAQIRHSIQSRAHSQWVDAIVSELNKAHQGIDKHIANIDIWVWGHGMIRPSPGFIWGEARRQAALPVGNKVFFAHTDLSGISIFEEAFYQGIRAAEEILKSI